MIIHHSRFAMRYTDYGIGIPVRDDRADRTFQALCGHSTVGARVAAWHYSEPLPEITAEDLLRAHDAAYVRAFLSDAPEAALMESYELLDEQGRYNRYDPAKAVRPLRELATTALGHVAGTAACAELALEHGFCHFLGGGMHHAMRSRGRGFCPLNDVVVAARRLQAQGRARLVWVIDTDAHKGDGTAEITLGDKSILCLSIHMAQGWPLDCTPLDSAGNLKRQFFPSDVDIPIPQGGEAYYLPALEHGLSLLEQLSAGQRPDLALVVGGADPFELDELPSSAPLRLSLEQMRERDLLVYRFLVGRGVPQAWVMAGGYGRESWRVYAQFLTQVLTERLG
ncbi:histone deacetylase [Desulfocurvibacter africanus]|uniref:histone deacetylase family protein n=1 Tax=Desulfocurvibacter africanus TaxID=873 RepID=UPI00041BB692|nr:histone deacetylase [Desulfocurvibacter africanus]